MSQIRVLLVDDQRLFLDGCHGVLETEPDMVVVGTATNAQEAMNMIQRLRPDVVVMDIEMPPGMNGINATRCLRLRDPDCRVVLLSAWNHHRYLLEGIRAGAVGYMLKDTARTDLVHAIRSAARDQFVVHPSVVQTMVDLMRTMHDPRDLPISHEEIPVVITERERNLLNLVANGLSNTELCDALGLPEGTLKSIIQKVFAKLGVHSRQEAVEVARRHGTL